MARPPTAAKVRAPSGSPHRMGFGGRVLEAFSTRLGLTSGAFLTVRGSKVKGGHQRGGGWGGGAVGPVQPQQNHVYLR